MSSELSRFLPVLRQVTIFAGLPEEGLTRIFGDCGTACYRAGEVIIREGDRATDLYVNMRGQVKIVLDMERNPIEVARFGPGNCLGEVSVIGILNHSASVVAVEDVDLLVISRKVLMDLFDNDKGLFSILILNIARELARRLQHTDTLLVKMSRESAGSSSLPSPA